MLLAELCAPPQGVTGASNVTSVNTVQTLILRNAPVKNFVLSTGNVQGNVGQFLDQVDQEEADTDKQLGQADGAETLLVVLNCLPRLTITICRQQ